MNKKIYRKKWAIILLVVSLVFSSMNWSYVFAAEDTIQKTNIFKGDGYEISYIVKDTWSGAYNGEIEILNTSPNSIHNWSLKFNSLQIITNIYDANISKYEDNVYIINGANSNSIIPSGESISFGFTASYDQDIEIPNAFDLNHDNDDYKIIDTFTYSNEKYDITLNISNHWNNSFLGDITITNLSNKIIENWSLEITSNYDIQNIWDAKIVSHYDNQYTLKNNMSNQDILPGKSVTFGFKANYENVFIPPTICELININEIKNNSFYDISFNITNDWDIAFNGELIIKNISESVIEDWQLEFDYPCNIDNIWNAEIIDKKGLHYTIKNAGYNSIIEPNQSIHIEFTGSPGNTSSTPSNYKLTTIETKHDKTRDTDNDGLTDYIEKELGTNPNSKDTDDDGVNDFDEILYNLNPLDPDSDKDGVIDSDEDFDEDGLSYKQELSFGTDNLIDDTDADGLLDGEEVNLYFTNPLLEDTDEDGINDGDEIKLGLNPLSKYTYDGCLDSEFTIKQNISNKNIEDINNNNSYNLTLSINAAGNANTLLNISESDYSDLLSENDAIVGKVISLSYEDWKYDNAEISFQVNDDIINNNKLIPVNDPGLEGIKRYQIFRYDDIYGNLVPVMCTFDEANNIITTETNQLGDYCIIDMERWLYMLGIELDEYPEIQNANQPTVNSLSNQVINSLQNEDSILTNEIINIDENIPEKDILPDNYDTIMADQIATVCNKNITTLVNSKVSSAKNKQIDITFIIDTSGSMYNTIENCKNYLKKLVKNLYFIGITARVSVISFDDWSSNIKLYTLSDNKWALKPEEADKLINQVKITDGYRENHLDALIKALEIQTNSNNIKFAVLLSDEPLNIHDNLDIRGSKTIANLLKQNKLITSVICRDYDIASFRPIFEETSGIQINIYSDFTKYLEQFIMDVLGADTSYWAISPTTLTSIKLKQAPKYGDKNTHSDDDGIPDSEEIDWANIRRDNDGNLFLPTLSEYLSIKYQYDLLVFNRLHKENAAKINSIVILPLLSNPTKEDSDKDSLQDNIDPKPLSTINNGKLISNLTKSQLTNLQTWLVALGYLDMKDNPYGNTYGGLTRTAVNLYQLNHGFQLEYTIDDITYDTIANDYYIYIDKRELYFKNACLSYKKYFDSIIITKPKLSKQYENVGVKVVSTTNESIKATTAPEKNIYLYDYTEPINELIYDKEFTCNDFMNKLKKYNELKAELKKAAWYFEKVTNKGPWDLKRPNRWAKEMGPIKQYSTSFPFKFNDYVINAEILGNITFGYWGNCIDYTLDQLLTGGDFANMMSTGKFELDSEEDKHWVRIGFYLYDSRR